jgi:HK97 family phage major capsid protein
VKLSKIMDGESNYLWSPAVAADQPDLLLAKPIHQDPAMPAWTHGLKPVVFGDLGSYVWICIVTRGQNGGGIQLDFR